MMLPKKIKQGLDNPEENWLISYADMMTLLTFLFIILYALAAQKQGVMKAVAPAAEAAPNSAVSQSAVKNPSSTDYAYYYIDKNTSSTSSKKAPAKSKDKASSVATSKTKSSPLKIKKTKNVKASDTGKPSYSEVQSFLSKNGLNSKVSLRQNETGIIFDIQAEILFDPGSSQLRSESYSLLDRISKYISTLNNDIIIAGHTDDQPIPSGQSSWGLSCERATNVLQYLTDIKKLSPERFQAVGYGSYRPIASNHTADGRQQNRRVEIIIVKIN